MWVDDDVFLQLPGVDYEVVKNFRKKNKNITIEQYCNLTREQRLEVGLYEDIKLFEESEKVIRCFPSIEVRIDYEVEGEKEIAVGDILTIRLTINLKNLKDDECLGFVHSN